MQTLEYYFVPKITTFSLSDEEAKSLRSFENGLMLTSFDPDNWELLPEDKTNDCLSGPGKFCFHAGK